MAKKNPANPAPSRPRSQLSNPPLQGDPLPLSDAPAGHTALPHDVAALVSVISTDELSRRPARPPNHAAENRALIALAQEMANSPQSILQNLVETALHLCRAHTAGISLLQEGQRRFYWPAIAGQWATHVGGGTPREYGPCGTVLDCNSPLLFSHPERDFPYFAPVTPWIEEALLVPFYVQGKAVGTIWVIAHDQSRRFDAEDLRMMTSLGKFAASAHQTLLSLNAAIDRNQELRQAGQALRESESRYRRLIDVLPAAVYVCDAAGYVTLYNQAALELWGRAPEIGKDRWCGSLRLYRPDGTPLPHEDCPMTLAASGQRAPPAEVIIERPDGARRHVLAKPQPIYDAAGSCSGALNILVDITDRKLAEQAVRYSEARYRQLIDALPAAVYVCDAEARVILYNQAAVELWGRTPEIGKDQWCGSLRMFHPDGRPMPLDECPMADAYHQGRAFAGVEAVIERPDGTRRNVLAHPQPIFDSSGEVTGAVNILVDVTERKLAGEAQARLAAIVESSDDAIISKNLDGIITSWNPAAQRIFGYTAAQAIGKHIVLIVPPELREEERSILERLRSGESIEHYETERVARDGRRIHVSLTISPMHDASGHMVGASKVAREIGDRKQADAMMAGQKEALELAISGAPINDVLQVLVRTTQAQSEGIARSAIFIVDTDGAHLRFAAAAGMPKTYTSAVDGFNIGPEFPSCGMAAHTGKAVIVRDVAQDPLWAPYLDLAQRHQICACWSFPILSRGGKVLGTFAVYHDHPRQPDPRDLQSINLLAQTAAVLIERHNAAQEREYAAESLRESEERFRFLADNAPVLIWVNGLEGCEFVNREYLRFLGCTFNDVLEMAWSRFIHPDDVEGYLAAYLRAFQRREPFDAQVRFRRADGEYRWMRATGAPRFTPGGAFVGYVGCSVDITEVKRSEDDLKQADQRKDEFLAMLGHELRNPLAAISTGATLLKQNPTEERRAWIEQMMFRQIEQLQRLVDDLLDVTRITRGKIQLRKQQLDLRKHLDAAVEAVAPLVQKHGHQLSVSLPDEAAFLHADPARFEQILVNLLTNAVKYTPNGGHISLSAEVLSVVCHSEDAVCLPAESGQAASEESQGSTLHESQPIAGAAATPQRKRTDREVCPTAATQSAQPQVVMRCRDTGAGITPEALEHIFEPFVQFDNAMHRSDSGLGMGLALVKRLAELHGGTVTAESDGPGRGSEFTVRLPLLAPEDVRPSQPTAEITATLPSEDALRVLVVDDNLDYAEGIAILLRAAGHSVSLAHHGEAGLLAAMREPPPDIILLDLGLPGLDGYAVAQRLRSPEIAARMKGATIVAVSGFSPKNAPKGRPNFFDAQLVKPIAHADLLGLLQEKLAARKAAVSPLASHRILLIEDNQEIALLTAELLRNRGLHVEVAFDGADGIEKAGSFRPHAILCDLHLPDMTGFDVAQRLRAASELARKEDASLSPPLLVAVTAFSADPLPARVDRGPFDHFMSKPLDWAELNRLLSSSEKKSMAVAP